MIELKNFISPEQVIFDIKEGSFEDIVRQLIVPLEKNKIVTSSEDFLKCVVHRENEISTCLGNLVAFPHARSRHVARLGISVGISKKEIKFGDNEEGVRTFFLLAIPSFAPTSHLPLLQLLVRFAHDKVRMDKFLRQKSPGMASRMLRAYKK